MTFGLSAVHDNGMNTLPLGTVHVCLRQPNFAVAEGQVPVTHEVRNARLTLVQPCDSVANLPTWVEAL